MKKSIYRLSGERDRDRFLSASDMSQLHWDLLMGCHHQGSCDDDVEEASRYFEILDPEKVRLDLKEFGAWSAVELSDDDANLRRYLWTLAGDIQEEQKTEVES